MGAISATTKKQRSRTEVANWGCDEFTRYLDHLVQARPLDTIV